MPFLSKIRTAASAGVRFAQALTKGNQQTTVSVRNMGGHQMVVKLSEYQKHRVKDDLIYFIGLGAIPLGLIITYYNVRVGPAELVDTPEGYVPEHYEYYKSPITRLMAKYLTSHSMEKYHERSLYYLYKADEKRKLKYLKQKVKEAQEQKKSQKGWYYVPMQDTLEGRIENAEGQHPVQGVKRYTRD